MSKKISTAKASTVRMFDGAGWDTYKVGSKKHRAAEARRAEWDAKADAKKKANKAQAAWMRENEIVPSGKAWALANEGERNVTKLRKANKKDGLTFVAPKPATAKKATAKKAAKVEAAPVEVAKPKASKAAKRRSKAARKAYATRVANGTVARVNGRFVSAKSVEAPAPEVDEAEAVRTSGKKALFWADLSDAGLNDAQIKAAWKARAKV